MRKTTELFAREDRYHFLLESVKDYAVFMLDVDGLVRTWNAGAEAIKGYRAEEIIGRHLRTFHTPEDVAAGKPEWLLATALRVGRAEDEGYRVRKDGTLLFVEAVITPILDSDGKHVGFAEVTRDLSRRHEADEALRLSEERFRMMVSSVKDYAIFMLDPEGRVQTWNEGARASKGYEAEEIIGRHISTFYPPEDVVAGKPTRLLEEAVRHGRVEDEGLRVRKDGTFFWADVVITAMRDAGGRLMGFTKVTRDLTQRRQADEELRAEREALSQAREALRMRDEFLSIAAHELKTPLTALQLQLQTILHSTPPPDQKLRLRTERAHRGGNRLGALIEALLDVSRLVSGKLTLSPARVELAGLVADVAASFEEQAERAGCTLLVHADRPLHGEWDAVRLEQILTNLLANALKYAAGSRVTVSLRPEGDRAVIEVRDQGPGIPESEWERVFVRFERAAPMNHFGGLGLGLYVARQLCEAHGGTLTLSGVEPHGACFTVMLPVTFTPPKPA